MERLRFSSLQRACDPVVRGDREITSGNASLARQGARDADTLRRSDEEDVSVCRECSEARGPQVLHCQLRLDRTFRALRGRGREDPCKRVNERRELRAHALKSQLQISPATTCRPMSVTMSRQGSLGRIRLAETPW